MDNLAAHHVERVRERLEGAAAQLSYLPPYSPDLNPMELWFAKPKALLRALRRRTTEELSAAVAECLRLFSPTGCRNYLRHCDYLPPTHS
jgi:transposase